MLSTLRHTHRSEANNWRSKCHWRRRRSLGRTVRFGIAFITRNHTPPIGCSYCRARDSCGGFPSVRRTVLAPVIINFDRTKTPNPLVGWCSMDLRRGYVRTSECRCTARSPSRWNDGTINRSTTRFALKISFTHRIKFIFIDVCNDIIVADLFAFVCALLLRPFAAF